MRNWLKTLTAALAMLLTIAALWFVNRPEAPATSTWEDVRAEARDGGYQLLSTEALAEMFQADPDLLLVDTRQEWEFRTGHIQGARFFAMEPTAWERWKKRGELKRFLGPDKERVIVFY